MWVDEYAHIFTSKIVTPFDILKKCTDLELNYNPKIKSVKFKCENRFRVYPPIIYILILNASWHECLDSSYNMELEEYIRNEPSYHVSLRDPSPIH